MAQYTTGLKNHSWQNFVREKNTHTHTYIYFNSGKAYHNSVVKPVVRTAVSGCYLRMQAESSPLFKEDLTTWNDLPVVHTGQAFTPAKCLQVLGR